MKKILMSIFVAAFLVACGSSQPAPEKGTDPVAAMNDALASYQNACGDIAFKDTRAALQEAQKLQSSNMRQEADIAMLRAQEHYDEGLKKYNASMASSEAYRAEITDQQSRLADLKADGTKYAPKEYAFAEKRVAQLHGDASARLDECDTDGAMYDLDDAEKELKYLEDVIATNMSAKVKAPATDTYTVAKGDCLWKIAAKKYANPYFWPLIYWSNKDSIKDPDLIYPNQKLKIDQNYNAAKKAEAEKFSKTRGPWSLYDGK